MFHVKHPLRCTEAGLFRMERSDDELTLHFADFPQHGLRMRPVEFGGRIIEQQRWRAPAPAPGEARHGQRQGGAEELLLSAREHVARRPAFKSQQYVKAMGAAAGGLALQVPGSVSRQDLEQAPLLTPAPEESER